MFRVTTQTTAIVLLGMLIVLSLWPDLKGPQIVPSDKVAHCAFYALTSCCAILGWPFRATLIAGGLLALGASIEIAQRSIPGRGFEWGDIAANGAGIALGAVSAFIIISITKRKI